MSGAPVVITPGGGIPVRKVASGAPLLTVAPNGRGAPITLTPNGAPFMLEGDDPDPFGRHRYWRIKIAGNQNRDPGNWAELSSLQMYDTTGSGDLCVGGTGISSPFQAGFPPANAFDGTEFTQWQAQPLGWDNCWIGYDFGAGKQVSVVRIGIGGTGGTFSRATPGGGVVQWSDDGATWVDAWPFVAQVQAAGYATVSYSRPTRAVAASRYWRIFMLGSYNVRSITISELGLFDAGATETLTVPGGAVSASSQFSTGEAPIYCVDRNTATVWASASTGYHWLQYDFGAGNEYLINKITLQARNDATFYNQIPFGIGVLFSDDGVNWVVADALHTSPVPSAPLELFTYNLKEWV